MTARLSNLRIQSSEAVPQQGSKRTKMTVRKTQTTGLGASSGQFLEAVPKQGSKKRTKLTARKTQTSGLGVTYSGQDQVKMTSNAQDAPGSDSDDGSTLDSFEFFNKDVLRERLPPLAPATGPPLEVEALLGGTCLAPPDVDPRLSAVSTGFPISVYSLRVPNARGLLSTASNFSVYGRVGVTVDAFGYQFTIVCWVVDLDYPVDMVLGVDCMTLYETVFAYTVLGPQILNAEAKKFVDVLSNAVYELCLIP
ncbi:hypothetical protein CERSUDRAFT_73898 [Gelatoporia subvermispora B]|uniref:Uncharacterized protein n=1 Tax=Ceriporiopsis subvermispora (strain B) TaxID=914234 RepID=M2QIL0_CERS8|nr:hypothetical protein CERSUDRAFT_73898 [Gelatoporia subvermispora B]